MLRTEFEDIIITQTPYYKTMDKTYRDYPGFKRYVSVLRKIAKSDSLLASFEQKGGREIVFLGRKIFALQEEFVSNYLNFLKDETNVNKWEDFFERYSKNLFEIYAHFTNGDASRVIIFEIVNRKLLRDLLTKHTTDRTTEDKISIIERFGMVVNQLFNYIRNSLARQVIVPDSLIVDSYEKIPLLPRCSRSETLKLLAKYIMQKGLPEPVFTAIFKSITTSLYTTGKHEVVKELAGKEVLSQDLIKDILYSHYFFPDEKSFDEIIGIVAKKAQEVITPIKEKRESTEKKISDIKSKMSKMAKDITMELIGQAEEFSTEEALDNNVIKLRRTLIGHGYSLKNLQREYKEYLKQENEVDALLKLKPGDLSKFIVKNEWDSFIILILNRNRTIDDEQLQLTMKDVTNEVKNDKTATAAINSFRVSGFLKERYNTAEITKRFNAIVIEIIQPLVQSFLLEELIDYYPRLAGGIAPETIRYLAEEAMHGKVAMVEKDIKVVPKQELPPTLNIMRYKDLVSVLVYDIRGSTFMGTKLQDAKKENEIRNLFQESMLAIVEKYGGIPIKDTGDGGIALYANNNYEILNQKTIELQPGATLAVVRSALEMVQEAKHFVEENITRYQNWFKTAEERKINFEGTTYATLPPSYQAIFQIGVGIASGIYPKEVFLDRNAFGELDLTGMLVREANFYSKVRAKEKSTIICDDSTIYNLLLNINKFAFLGDSGFKMDTLQLDLEQALEYWINQRVTRRGFILDLYKIFVTELGQELLHPGSLKILLGVDDIVVDESGEIKDGKGGRGKFLFEVSQEVQK